MTIIHTLSEAAVLLSEETHRQWTETEILELFLRYGVTLYAVRPIDAGVIFTHLIGGRIYQIPENERFDFLLEPGICPSVRRGLVTLFPHHIQSLLVQGEAITETPGDHDTGQKDFFVKLSRKVRVGRAEVRIMPDTLSMTIKRCASEQKQALPNRPGGATSGTPQKAAPGVTPDDWKVCARAIADELHEKDIRAGAHDSISNIADRVALEMRSRKIHGTRGPLAGNTIAREALQGGKWKRKT